MRIQRYDSLIIRDFKAPYEALHAKAAQEVMDEPPPPPPAPVFSQSDVDSARQAGYKVGYDEGVQAGVNRVVNETHLRDNDAAAAMHKLAGDIGELQKNYEQVLHAQKQELTELVLLIARKVASDALQKNAEKMIESMVTQCLPLIIFKPRVLIDLHPEMVEKVESHLTTLLREAGFTGDVTVRASSNLARHDVKIDWAAGYAERSTTAIWAEVSNLLNQITSRTDDSTPNHETTT